MLKFAVMDGSLPAVEWPLRHAHLLGPDDVALPSEIDVRDGMICCSKRIGGAAALAVTFSLAGTVAGAAGGAAGGAAQSERTFLLRTCLLPERGEPYLLSLELARRQVMLLLNKLEEWSLFDQPADSPLMLRINKAVAMFSRAAVSGSPGPHGPTLKADALAREALREAIEAGEQLAFASAAATHKLRLSGRLSTVASLVSVADSESKESAHPHGASAGVCLPEMPQIGCCVGASVFSPELAAAVQQSCDFVSLPMRWLDMEPSEGKYAFAKTDKWIEWCILQAKLPVVAGPVLDLSEKSVPKWLAIFEHDYETLRDMVIEFVKTIVTRYRRTVTTWNVCSGLHAPGGLSLSPEQAMDLTKYCIAIVKKLQPQAKVQIEIAQPFGEYTAGPKGRACLPPAIYAELIKQLNLPIDALAIRLQLGSGDAGRATRDILSCAAMIDRYAEIGYPISISAVGFPGNNPARQVDDESGMWNGPWTLDVQAELLSKLGGVLAGKPAISSIAWHELYDVPTPAPAGCAAGEMPGGGLVTSAGAAKPVLAAVKNLRQVLRMRGEKLV